MYGNSSPPPAVKIWTREKDKTSQTLATSDKSLAGGGTRLRIIGDDFEDPKAGRSWLHNVADFLKVDRATNTPSESTSFDSSWILDPPTFSFGDEHQEMMIDAPNDFFRIRQDTALPDIPDQTPTRPRIYSERSDLVCGPESSPSRLLLKPFTDLEFAATNRALDFKLAGCMGMHD